jgi:hypothetical protein
LLTPPRARSIARAQHLGKELHVVNDAVRLAVAAALVLLAAGRIGAQGVAPGDHYLCYEAKAARADQSACAIR